MEVLNNTYKVFLQKKIEVESDQALDPTRSYRQHLLSYTMGKNQQDPDFGKL